MFFLLSKLLVYFTYPLTWILLLLLLRLVVKPVRLKKRLLVSSIVIFLLFSNMFLLNRFAQWWDYAPVHLPPGSHYGCAIVLGGFSLETSKGDTGYFNTNADRFIQGMQLYRQGFAPRILITGGNGSLHKSDFSEGSWTRQQLLLQGIPDSAILVENNARNTLENALFTKHVIDSLHIPPPYIMVTSAFHMRRSVWIFNNVGLPVTPYPCNYIAGAERFKLMDVLPQPLALSTWNTYIKEVIGCVAYSAKQKL